MEFKDFISKRVREVELEIANLREKTAIFEEKIQVLEGELAHLSAAERAMGMVNGLHRRRRQRPPITIKEAILEILKDYPDGLLALDVLAKINDRYPISVVRTSLSPQLTRLRREGKIVNHRNFWLLNHETKHDNL